jgi:ornithine cyclodeaminase/alanine dehydrogenase-like protein (mu-crystallin family)
MRRPPSWVEVNELPMAAAIDAVEQALLDGLDPDADLPRVRVGIGDCDELLLMEATHGPYAGVKVVTVAAGNPARGLPHVQGVYVLFSADTLGPIAVMDGAAITALRTPAVSAVAAKHLARAGARRLLVYGLGVQARGHLEAMRLVLPELESVEVIGRGRGNSERFAGKHGGTFPDDHDRAVREADVICCCTSSRTPLFDGTLVRDDATVIAVGTHEPSAHELDTTLMGRAAVVAESRTTALREAGDVIQAIEDDLIDERDLIYIDQLVRGQAADALAPVRPRVFKSAGMSWEDVVVAGAAYERARG